MTKYVRRSKEEIRQKRIRKVIFITSALAVVLTAAVIYSRQSVKKNFASSSSKEVKTAEVSIGSIKTTVSGSGSLTSEGILDVEIPIQVKLEDTLVEAGDNVEEGDMLATINVSSALTTLKSLQASLKTLDSSIQSASNDTISSYITAGVAGRVKAIFAEADDDVAGTVAEHGALMLLSLDGYMQAQIPAGNLEVGEEVDVIASQKTYTGTVSGIEKDVATVLVTDNGPLNGESVTIGNETAELSIHQPLKITGYAGTVKTISVSENTNVYSSTTLLTLTDTSYSAGLEQLLSQRAEMEDVYQSLVKMVSVGGIQAEYAGTIQTITEIDDPLDTSSYSATDLQTIMTIDPNETASVTISVDETNIQSLDVGQEASITIDSIGEDVFTGVVSEIDKTATSASGVTVYTATITLDKTPSMLSGMTADVAITIEGTDNAMLIPADAVRKTSATSYVYTTYDEDSGDLGGMVEVTTGLTNGSYTEITSGLNEGDTVYYTEKQTQSFGGFNPGGMGGGMPGGMGGGMPSGGGMPGGPSNGGGNRNNGGGAPGTPGGRG